MAIPELGQIRIIPDYINYGIASGNGYSASADTSESYKLFDHRKASYGDKGSNGDWFIYSLGNPMSSGREKMFIGYANQSPNLDSATFITSTSTKITTGYTAVVNTSVATEITLTAQHQYCVATLASGTSPTGVGLYESPSNTVANIIHIGEIYTLPHNATASLSYNTEYQNRVNTAFSGASYSTLYNTKPQTILSVSWEYISWEASSPLMGISELTHMMTLCFGSHIPVAIQFSQAEPITSDHFMFMRITKWNQSQMSPTLWQISAEFEELI